jgi:tetratricopeptide (TPR) repeat protein|tara:strand:- start:96 stop:671 length:576 start_codon:yes stop_codon:yes gene_type:complete
MIETSGNNMKLTLTLSLLLLSACSTMQGFVGGNLEKTRASISDPLIREDIDAAQEAAIAAEKRAPMDPIVALLAADAHERFGDEVAAQTSLNRAIALEPQGEIMALALKNRACLAMRSGNPEQAQQDFSAAYEACGGDNSLLRNLGAAAYAAGDFPSARQAWQKLPLADRRSIDLIVGPGFFEPTSVALSR